MEYLFHELKKRDNIVLFVFKITCKILLAKEPIFKTVKKRLVLCNKREMKARRRGNQVVKSKNCSLYFFQLQRPVGIKGREVFWKTFFVKLKKSALSCVALETLIELSICPPEYFCMSLWQSQLLILKQRSVFIPWGSHALQLVLL